MDTGTSDVSIGHLRARKDLPSDGLGRRQVATDDRERREVELRTLSASDVGDAAQRIVGEAQALVGLDHPNLAAVLDAGEDDGAVWIETELAKGESLSSVIASEGTLDLASSLRIGEEIASAIAMLHRSGHVHGALNVQRVVLDEQRATRVTGLGLGALGRGDDGPRGDVRAIGDIVATIAGPNASSNPQLAKVLARCADADPSRQFADADAVLAALSDVDLPTEPIGEQVGAARAEIAEQSSPKWILGASILLGVVLVIAFAVVLLSAR